MVRLKHRYLLVQILYPTPIPPTTTPQPNALTFHAPTPDALTPALLLRALRTTILSLFGEHGAALGGSALSLKYFSNATSTFILRCRRGAERVVGAALAFLRWAALGVEKGGSGKGGTGQRECVFRVVRVSGTVRKSMQEAVRGARRVCGVVGGLEGRGAGVGWEEDGEEEDAGLGVEGAEGSAGEEEDTMDGSGADDGDGRG